eukprot:Seg756.3 transcript_id=Seg756.3/GoldUCD/mRNA.D3Y31 product="Maternal embryonic leucine zipper kinase" protein_id=Seg756.3/GoldUCD/D3Y31
MPGTWDSTSSIILPEEIALNYEDKNKKLGEGGFARVQLAEHIPTGEKVAIKIMSKDHLKKMGDLHRAYREINAMRKLSHQHISQLYQVVETEDDIFMVMEYLSGGELFDYIVAKEKLSETEARRFFRQIISAVAYMHEKGLAHRDLKPADIWSLGVVLYGLLCGFLPFDVENEDETHLLYQKIKSGEYEVPDWLSEESARILARLLETDPIKRITITELLTDDWMREGYGSNVHWQSVVKKEKPDINIMDELAEFHGISKFEMERRVKEDCMEKWTLRTPTKMRERSKTYCGNENDLENELRDDDGSMPSPLLDSKDKSTSVFEGFCMVGMCTPARQNKYSTVAKTPIPIGLATPKFAKKLKEKVVHLMTPRKGSSSADEPRKVKAIYKVNSTSTKTASEVRCELDRVLSHLRSRGKLNSIDSSENFLFKCKGDDGKGSKLSFELEICSVPGLENMVGIRHKRLKGDAWAYKKMCDCILNIAKI